MKDETTLDLRDAFELRTRLREAYAIITGLVVRAGGAATFSFRELASIDPRTDLELVEEVDGAITVRAVAPSAVQLPRRSSVPRPLGDDGVDPDRAAGLDSQADVDAHGGERGGPAAVAAEGDGWRTAPTDFPPWTVGHELVVIDTDGALRLASDTLAARARRAMRVPAVVADVGIRSAGAAGHEASVARGTEPGKDRGR